MAVVQGLVESYFNFHYGIAGAVGILILCIYLIFIKRQGRITFTKTVAGVFFAAYLAVLIGGTILSREIGLYGTDDFIPFWSYYEVFARKDVVVGAQMLANVILFIPWGIVIPTAFPCMRRFVWNVVGSAIFSATIEVVQLLFECGRCELDDVIHNTLGAVIGYGIWMLGYKVWKKYIRDEITKWESR